MHQGCGSPRGSLGGREHRAGLHTLHACHCPDPHPGRSDGSAVPGRSHAAPRHPGRAGARAPLTMLAGGRGGSGELALGLRIRPVRTVQVMIPAASGRPHPCRKHRFPSRAPRGPSRRSAAPRPASSGTPRETHPHPPAPPQVH